MSIDNKIKEYQEWKKLIDNILQELRKYDKTKLKVVEYKFLVIYLKMLLQMNYLFQKQQLELI